MDNRSKIIICRNLSKICLKQVKFSKIYQETNGSKKNFGDVNILFTQKIYRNNTLQTSTPPKTALQGTS